MGCSFRPTGTGKCNETTRALPVRPRRSASSPARASGSFCSVAMSGELQMLAHQLNHISEQHRRYRDFTLNMLRCTRCEVLVSFPVYRIYPGPGQVSDGDRGFVLQATALAKRRNPAMDSSIFDFIRDILLLQHPPELSVAAIAEREQLAGRIQQVTSPLMAKGVEDTAFYVYCPLVSTNEVGNSPESPVVPSREFHQWNVERAEHYPAAMLTASTHDTKRSEDVRSRLHVLAESPLVAERREALGPLSARRLEVEGRPAPSRTDEYMIYQTCLVSGRCGSLTPHRSVSWCRARAVHEQSLPLRLKSVPVGSARTRTTIRPSPISWGDCWTKRLGIAFATISRWHSAFRRSG